MKPTVFYLKTCGTCKKIMASLDLSEWELREVKSTPISKEELDILYQKSGSYESLFSKKSTQIKLRNIEVKSLTETDLLNLLLDHYSFLKRPVFYTKDAIFIGSEKKNVEALFQFFEGNQ